MHQGKSLRATCCPEFSVMIWKIYIPPRIIFLSPELTNKCKMQPVIQNEFLKSICKGHYSLMEYILSHLLRDYSPKPRAWEIFLRQWVP